MRFDPIACGNRIRTLRQQKNLTQEQLAEELSIFYKYVSKIENGNSTASLDLLIDIADYFGVTVDYLLLGRTNTQENLKRQIQAALNILTAVEQSL